MLAEKKIGAVVVSEDGVVVEGIISERDIVRAVAKGGGEALQQSVSSMMTADVITCERTDTVESVIDTGTEYQLCTRSFQSQDTVIRLSDDVVFGDGRTVMMAGPCAVESEDQIMRTARFLRERHRVAVFRAGARGMSRLEKAHFGDPCPRHRPILCPE